LRKHSVESVESVVRIKVKYMLWLIDKVGISEEVVEIPGEPTLGELINVLAESKTGRARELLLGIQRGETDVVVLVNSKTPPNGLDTKLRDGDNVVLIPPVSGGAI
jgi:molybdopterin synthase sulfur carrier subunit